MANSNIAQLVGQHIDTYRLAKTVETLYGFNNYEFIKKFAVIDEQLEAQEKQMMADQQSVVDASQPTSLEMELEANEPI